MNATRPEAGTEYSSAPEPRSTAGRGFWTACALTVAGVLALLVAQILALDRVETIAAHPLVVQTVRTGPHEGWALVPLAALAVLLTGIGWRGRRRAAFAGIGVVGLAALAIALLIDRPALHATGAVQVARVLHPAQIRAGAGLYVETLGGALLVLAAGAGLLL